jgi:hypothetical protein
MSLRSFLGLLAVAVVAAVVAIVLIVVEQVSAESPSVGGTPMFPALRDQIEDLQQVVIETNRYSLTLENRDGTWVAADLGDYPIESDPLVQIISSLTDMTTVEPKTSNPDWYRYIQVDNPADVTDPSVTPGVHIMARAADGATLVDAIFGAPSSSIGYARNGGTFVRRTDEAQAWLVQGAIQVPTFQEDWFSQLLSIPGTDIARITILLGDEVVLDAEKVNFATGDYELTYLSDQIGPAGSTANDNGLRGVAQGVVSTSFEAVRLADTVTFADDARTVRFVTSSGLQLDVRLGEADGDIWVTYQASAPEGSDAVAEAQSINERADRWAFKLLSYRITALNRDLTDLFDPPAVEEEAPASAPAPLFPLPLPGP